MKGIKEGRPSNSSHGREGDTHYRLGRIPAALTGVKRRQWKWAIWRLWDNVTIKMPSSMQWQCWQIYSTRTNKKEWRDLQWPATETWTSFVTRNQNLSWLKEKAIRLAYISMGDQSKATKGGPSDVSQNTYLTRYKGLSSYIVTCLQVADE